MIWPKLNAKWLKKFWSLSRLENINSSSRFIFGETPFGGHEEFCVCENVAGLNVRRGGLNAECFFMNPEILRIADQLRRAFDGEAWHGPSLSEVLAGVNAKQAQARPLANAHSIWELVLHLQTWTQAGIDALKGVPMPASAPPEVDFPPPPDVSGQKSPADKLWTNDVQALFRTGQLLREAVESLDDRKLDEIVPGRKYKFYFLFHGIVQHTLYHAGQIALLKKGA